jgi:hypothetical protein
MSQHIALGNENQHAILAGPEMRGDTGLWPLPRAVEAGGYDVRSPKVAPPTLTVQRYLDLTVDRFSRFCLVGLGFFRLRTVTNRLCLDRRDARLRVW